VQFGGDFSDGNRRNGFLLKDQTGQQRLGAQGVERTGIPLRTLRELVQSSGGKHLARGGARLGAVLLNIRAALGRSQRGKRCP
jgi:hypothetical protein